MTGLTVRGRGRYSGFGVVTSEASGMTVWNRLDRALLQPECIAQLLRRLGHVLFAGFTLRLIRLMTNGTVCWRLFRLLALVLNCNELRSGRSWAATTDYLQMSFMREIYGELAAEVSLRLCSVCDVAQTRKQETGSIARRYRDVAIGADSRGRPFTREELLPVAIQAGAMFRKFRDVLKSGLTFTNFLPVRRREFVAGIAGELFFGDVSRMRKV